MEELQGGSRLFCCSELPLRTGIKIYAVSNPITPPAPLCLCSGLGDVLQVMPRPSSMCKLHCRVVARADWKWEVFYETKTWRFLFSQYCIPVPGGYIEKGEARTVITELLYGFIKKKKRKWRERLFLKIEN